MSSSTQNEPAGTVVITGGTVNIGYEAALAIAKAHPKWRIVLASRSDPNNAVESIAQQSGNEVQQATFIPLDLSSQQSIRDFTSKISSSNFPPIRILLLSAGILGKPELTYSPDGYEQTFATNNLGHAYLFFLLRPHLAPTSRIILTTSGTHDPANKTGMPFPVYPTAEELAHPTPEQAAEYNGRRAYATSKLCTVLWTYALHRRLQRHPPEGQNWSVAAFNPGLMPGTGLARDAPAVLKFLWLNVLPWMQPLLRRFNIHTPQESGPSLAALAMGEEELGGRYFEGGGDVGSSEESYNEERQEDLWGWIVRALARGEGEKAAFERVYLKE